jgi:hypothetical protein
MSIIMTLKSQNIISVEFGDDPYYVYKIGIE